MKSIVKAEAFASALAKAGAQRRVSKRNGKHLRFDFMGNICRVTGSDFSAWLTVELPADGDTFTFVLEEPRQVIRLCAFLRGPLTVELDGEGQNCKITLSSDGKTGTFPVSSPTAYPLPPHERPIFRRTTDVQKLAGRIKSVSYAALELTYRPSYANVYFQDQRLWCVDGYRLAVSQDDSFCAKQPFLVRALDLEQLKLFDKGKVRIEVGKKFVTFLGNGITLICRKAGDQPCVDLDKVIPCGPMEQYAVDRKQYMDALKYLSECAHGINRPSVVFDHGVLELTGKHGLYTAGLDVEGKCELPYRFNLRYMLEALKQFDGMKSVTVSTFGASNRPILLTSEKATAMVLPIRFSEAWAGRTA